MPIARAATDSAANTPSSPAGDIEQLRLSVRLKPPSPSRNVKSRLGNSWLGAFTERRKLPHIKDLGQEKAPSASARRAKLHDVAPVGELARRALPRVAVNDFESRFLF